MVSDILPIARPMPLPLRHGPAHAVATQDGCVLGDAGVPSHQARRVLADGPAPIGGVSAVRAIVVTPFHPDHSGLAGRVQQEARTRVDAPAAGGRPTDAMAAGRAGDREMATAEALAHPAALIFERRVLARPEPGGVTTSAAA